MLFYERRKVKIEMQNDKTKVKKCLHFELSF
jgi:hypothetical protein